MFNDAAATRWKVPPGVFSNNPDITVGLTYEVNLLMTRPYNAGKSDDKQTVEQKRIV